MRLSAKTSVILATTFLCLAILLSSNRSWATPLNSWKISCGVDKGSITRQGRTWTFRTSSNKCKGGNWRQRAELTSKNVSPNTKGWFMFTSYVAMKTSKTETYDVFQIHDGRLWCAPPLKVEVRSSGQIKLVSDIQTGSRSCIRSQLSNKLSRARIRRDGNEQKLEVLIEFNGDGGFEATVWVDGAQQINGTYKPPPANSKYRSKYFFFKHGVYSANIFPYMMTSRNMSVRRLR